MKDIEEKFNELLEKRNRVNELYDKLGRSIALKKLCPSAFDFGKCSTCWMTDEDRNPVFQIKRGDGSTITFEFSEVSDSIKMEEANRRGLTGIAGIDKTNDPVNKAIGRYINAKKMNERRINRGYK